jgi:hypothetical protein
MYEVAFVAHVIHNAETLMEIEGDLKSIIKRLEDLRGRMKDQDVKDVPIDHHKSMVKARLWLHGFAADGEESLREVVAQRKLKEVGEGDLDERKERPAGEARSRAVDADQPTSGGRRKK